MIQQHLLHEAVADAIQSIIAPSNPILSMGQLIENEMFHKLATFNSWIKKYRLLFGDINDFANSKKDGYLQ